MSPSELKNVLDGTNCVSAYPKLTLAGICRGGDVQCTHEVIRFGEQGLDFRRHSGSSAVWLLVCKVVKAVTVCEIPMGAVLNQLT